MNLANLFSTPIASFEHPDMAEMNQELTRILVRESESQKGIQHSNVGSWHSPNNLHLRKEPCFRKVIELIIGNAFKTSDALAQTAGKRLNPMPYKYSAWAMVMREGHYTIPHTHSNVHWACVYYPDAGDADYAKHAKSGDIGFLDPRSDTFPIPGLDQTVGEFVVRPKTGQMLVFPGWLMHFVHAYHGTRPRISIACNVLFDAP